MILFLTLKVFSATGGIEKVCRVAGKALYEYGMQQNVDVKIMSMHGPKDAAVGNKYFPAELFTGFHSARFKFMHTAINAGRKSDTVILSHINLLSAGWLIKKISPGTKLILIAHGIEVWQPLNKHQKMMLNVCDQIIAVSKFTSDKLEELLQIPASKRCVINNCIDPFLELPQAKLKDAELLKRYDLDASHTILLTLTRLSAKDRYKGYDKVLQSVATLAEKNKSIRYILAGKYDDEEKDYIDEMIAILHIREHVRVVGFVKDEELPALFSLADIYVMPSIKEGFGIVFVEAMYYGVPAIAGNEDGSADALLHGELGLLIDPNDKEMLTEAIEKMISSPEKYIPDHKKLMEHFGYEGWKRKLEEEIRC